MKNIGTRTLVWHKKAKRTSGYLFRKDLVMNKYNRIVSKRKHNLMKSSKNPLRQRNMLQSKGSKKFGPKGSKYNINKDLRNKKKRSKSSQKKSIQKSFLDIFNF